MFDRRATNSRTQYVTSVGRNAKLLCFFKLSCPRQTNSEHVFNAGQPKTQTHTEATNIIQIGFVVGGRCAHFGI